MRAEMRRVTDRARAFYRSPLTPVSFVLFGLYIAWSLSPWGPTEWRNTPSLRLIHSLIPWPLMSGAFLLYVLLVLAPRLSAVIVGDVLGLLLYGVAFAALAASLRPDKPANPIAFASVGLACMLHVLAIRLAIIEWQERRQRGPT